MKKLSAAEAATIRRQNDVARENIEMLEAMHASKEHKTFGELLLPKNKNLLAYELVKMTRMVGA